MTNIRQNNTNINDSNNNNNNNNNKTPGFLSNFRKIMRNTNIDFSKLPRLQNLDEIQTEEMNFGINKNRKTLKTDEQIEMENKLDDAYTAMRELQRDYKGLLTANERKEEEEKLKKQYGEKAMEEQGIFVPAGPELYAASNGLDTKVQELTDFDNYEDFKTYLEELENKYKKKLENKVFLPIPPESDETKKIDSSIKVCNEIKNIYSNTFDELNLYRNQIPSDLVEKYDNARAAAEQKIETYGSKTQEEQGIDVESSVYALAENIGLNEKINMITNGEYTTYVEFMNDYNEAKSRIELIKGNIDNLKTQKENYVYRDIQNSEVYKNFAEPYRVVIINDIDPDKGINFETYKFYDENGKEITDSNLLLAMEASQMKRHEEYIKEILHSDAVDIQFETDYYKTYLYLQEYYNQDVANQFIKDMKDEMNSMIGLKNAVEFCKELNTTDKNEIPNLFAVHFKGVEDGLIDSFEDVTAWITKSPEKTQNYYEALWITQFLATNEYGMIQSQNYELGQGIGESLPGLALSSINPVFGQILSQLYNGMATAGNTYKDQIWAGVDEETAQARGLLMGASNQLTKRLLANMSFFDSGSVKINNFTSMLEKAMKTGNSSVMKKIVDSIILGKDLKSEDLIKTWITSTISTNLNSAPKLVDTKLANDINEMFAMLESDDDQKGKKFNIKLGEISSIISTLTNGIYNAINESANSKDIITEKDITEMFDIILKEYTKNSDNDTITEKYVEDVARRLLAMRKTEDENYDSDEIIKTVFGKEKGAAVSAAEGAKQATERIKVANSSHPTPDQGAVLRPEQRVATMNNDNTSYPTSGQGVVLETKKTDSNPNNSTQI